MKELLQKYKQSIKNLTEQVKIIMDALVQELEKKVDEFLLDIKDNFVDINSLNQQLQSIINLLEKAKIHVNQLPTTSNDFSGNSALDYACELQDPMILSLLLSHRYQLSLEGSIDIGKLLRRAAHEGDADVIQKLLEKWPNKVNEKDQGKTERTALHWAVIRGHESCVKILLAAGADASISDKENYSAIDWAKKFNHVAIHRLLENIPSTNFFKSSTSSNNEASSYSSVSTLRPRS